MGFVPLPYDRAVLFFLDSLPRHGYLIGARESEPWEAEARISGRGYTGAWKVVKLDCRDLSAFVVGVMPRRGGSLSG